MAQLQRQEYAALLGLLQPGQAATVFEGRVKSINDVNLQIADWLAERRRVEEAYAAGLSRLVARHEQGSFTMGVFQIPWSNLVTHTAALSEAHLLLAKRISDDVEEPLRQYASSNPNMKNLSGAEESLRNMSKEFEDSQRKAQKAQDRGRADTSGFEATSLQWDSQAPFSFEKLQAADEARVAHLQSVLTQFATHEVDAIERSRTGAENALNTILNIDATEEISSFVARVSQSATNAIPQRSAGIRPATAGDTEPGVADSSALTSGGPSDRPSSLASGVNGAPPVPEPRKKSRLSGLKRLGTVITRTGKDKDVKDDMASTKESEKAKRKNPLRRGSSLPQAASPNDSSADLRLQEQRNESVADLGRNTLPPIPTGETSLMDEPGELPNAIAPVMGTTGGAVNGERTNQTFSSIPEEPTQTSSSPTTYSPPSSSLSAIEQAQREANIGNDDDSSPFKVDIRREPIQEEGSDAALASIGLPPQRRQPTSTRGRRDVRNTVFVPNSPPTESENTNIFGSASAGAIGGAALGGASILAMRPAQQFMPQSSSSISGDEHRGIDTQSIRSATSTTVAAPARHPELTGAGLQASIIETVNMTLSSGSVVRGSVLGEIALAHPSGSSNESPTIRLANFESLEKVAPNPAFITPSTTRDGDYTVFSSAISSSTPTVAFKYQVHLDESNTSSHAPLIISPIWKVEDKQTSVIVNYSPNPSYPVSTLQNLSITLSLDPNSARPSSCLSKPSGAFSRERGIIVWRLGSFDLNSNEGGKLLARFVTESAAKPGVIEAKFDVASETPTGMELGVALLGGGAGAGADPFADADADEESERSIVVRKRVVTGKYTAS